MSGDNQKYHVIISKYHGTGSIHIKTLKLDTVAKWCRPVFAEHKYLLNLVIENM